MVLSSARWVKLTSSKILPQAPKILAPPCQEVGFDRAQFCVARALSNFGQSGSDTSDHRFIFTTMATNDYLAGAEAGAGISIGKSCPHPYI